MSEPAKLPEQLTTQITQFIENTPTTRLSRNLRNMLLHYQIIQKDGYPFNMDDLLTDILNLFDLLDAMEQERK